MTGADEAFEAVALQHGLLRDLPDARLWGIDDGALVLGEDSTQFVFCLDGALSVRQSSGWPHVVCSGMYAAVPGKCEIKPVGANLSRGIVISRPGWLGMFSIGGPLEERGRLRYIDGCTDSLLVPPVRMGDPCFNGLWFPMGTKQTSHTHPSVRIGMVVRGRGRCVTPWGVHELRPGMVFVIHAEGEHRFETGPDAGLTVVAWHPDSDCGPTDQEHPMVRRTMVGGVSAAVLPEIQTR
jgi:hypothetical protein